MAAFHQSLDWPLIHYSIYQKFEKYTSSLLQKNVLDENKLKQANRKNNEKLRTKPIISQMYQHRKSKVRFIVICLHIIIYIHKT